MPSIHFLPSELLSFILDIVCHTASPAKTTEVSQMLSLVSKLWRSVVLSTPSIWTEYYIHARTTPRNTELALERSGALPLTLRAVDDSSDVASIKDHLSTLETRSSRWRILEITHPSAAVILESSIPSILPDIHSMVVKVTPPTIDLSRLEHYPFQPPPMPIPPAVSLEWNSRQYAAIRHFELSRVEVKASEVNDFLGFLEACSSLNRLVLDGIWERNAYDAPRSVTLPALQDLELRGVPSSAVVKWIVAPSLQRLVLEKIPQLRHWNSIDAGPHFGTVTDVTLIRFSTLPTALREILHAVPLVVDLQILSYDFRSPYSLSADIVIQERPLPCLSSLHIQGIFSLYQLRKAVEFHGETLRSVKVHCLDLGLPDESFAKEYVERDEALKWLKEESPAAFNVVHSGDVYGSRFWSHDDRRWRREMRCDSRHETSAC